MAFGTDWFTVEQAADVTLFRTPFLPGAHLKKLTLVPAEQAGVLDVDRPAKRRAGAFTEDVRMRFKE